MAGEREQDGRARESVGCTDSLATSSLEAGLEEILIDVDDN